MAPDSDEISLQELAAALWDRRRLIALVTALATAIAATTALLLPVKYEAAVVLSPVDDDGGGKLGGGGLLSQLGGLAALGGLSLGNSGKKAESLATLQSAALTESFIDERKLLPVLYADDWDAANQRWTADKPEDAPTLWKAERKFRKKIRSVDEDKKTGLVTLTIEWKDPQQAADWANDLVARANRQLRERAIATSRRNLAYLNEQVGKTSVVELQKSIYALIEAEIKKVMVAQGNDEYAFKVIDPARVPELRASPKRTLITAIGFVVGLMAGAMLALALPRRRVPANVASRSQAG